MNTVRTKICTYKQGEQACTCNDAAMQKQHREK